MKPTQPTRQPTHEIRRLGWLHQPSSAHSNAGSMNPPQPTRASQPPQSVGSVGSPNPPPRTRTLGSSIHPSLSANKPTLPPTVRPRIRPSRPLPNPHNQPHSPPPPPQPH